MKTIRKNQKKARELFERDDIECTVYSLSYNFEPEGVDKSVVERALHDSSNAKLIETQVGVSYTVQVHSNLWYTVIIHTS